MVSTCQNGVGKENWWNDFRIYFTLCPIGSAFFLMEKPWLNYIGLEIWRVLTSLRAEWFSLFPRQAFCGCRKCGLGCESLEKISKSSYSNITSKGVLVQNQRIRRIQPPWNHVDLQAIHFWLVVSTIDFSPKLILVGKTIPISHSHD